ncbi:type VI secretion system-associated protein TagF [Jiella marina]|uniref:type VI secretion system-associated protein TagF n=1 Tax=Jiella sp. LLJ827 TaxID=2917712 RepID=UPI00210135E6|nr:type VI secretion system-associated protein TagF [Jiella sp. LLJ827]MCQ0988632.1 type VI secretion system-associated protein TagF [Jiella sp. LLJ827]
MSVGPLSEDAPNPITEPGSAGSGAACGDAAPACIFALFGKLPQRRDFVSHGMPKTLLNAWEGWLEQAVAQSRKALGEEFDDRYMVMPAWRFWFGRAVVGVSACGVLIPSVDGVGRKFPLTLFALAPEDHSIELPLIDPMERVFSAMEARLLDTLSADTGAPFDVAEVLNDLPQPPIRVDGAAPAGSAEREADDAAPAVVRLLQEACRADHRRLAEGSSYFWTAGHADAGAPAWYSCSGLPQPQVFAAMLDGKAPDLAQADGGVTGAGP